MADPNPSSEKLNAPAFRRATVLTATLLMTGVFLYMIRGFLQPMFLAAIFAGLLQPVYRRLVTLFRGRQFIASIATIALTLLLIVGPLTALIGLIAAEAVAVKDAALPWISEQLEGANAATLERKIVEKFPALEPLVPDKKKIAEALGNAATVTGEFLVRGLTTMTTGAASFLLGLFVMLYAMYFYLTDGPRLLNRIMQHVPLDADQKKRLLDRFLSVTRATIKGTVVIGLVQGGLGGIAFKVGGLPSAAFWGAVMVVLSIVPGIGTAIVWIPAVIYLFVQGEPTTAILMGAWFAVVVGTADNVLRPILVGRDTQMPDLLILGSTLGGIVMFGIIGFIAGPVVCALFMTSWDLYSEAYRDALEPAQAESPKP